MSIYYCSCACIIINICNINNVVMYSSQAECWRHRAFIGWGSPCLVDLIHDLYTKPNKYGFCPLVRRATLCWCGHQRSCPKVQMYTDMWSIRTKYGRTIDTDFKLGADFKLCGVITDYSLHCIFIYLFFSIKNQGGGIIPVVRVKGS